MVRLLLVLILIGVAPSAATAMENQLRDNTSPYLAMHADDPVQWQIWDQSVLDQARKENKIGRAHV